MLLSDLREEVVSIGLKMVQDGVAHNGQGNISSFDRDSGLIAITPSAVPYDERTGADICVVNLDGDLIDGRWKPTSEIALHLIYYRKNKNANAVVHTHAPYATVFGIINEKDMPVVLNEAAMGLGGPLPVAPYARPGSSELAAVTYQATGDSIGAIMAHHGLVTIGPNLTQAYNSTLAAESTARIIILARSMGANVQTIDTQEAKELREIFLAHYHAVKM